MDVIIQVQCNAHLRHAGGMWKKPVSVLVRMPEPFQLDFLLKSVPFQIRELTEQRFAPLPHRHDETEITVSYTVILYVVQDLLQGIINTEGMWCHFFWGNFKN